MNLKIGLNLGRRGRKDEEGSLIVVSRKNDLKG